MEQKWIHDIKTGNLIEVDDLSFSKPILAFDFDGVMTKPEAAKSKLLSSLGYEISENQVDGAIAKQLMFEQNPHNLSKEEIKKQYHSTVGGMYAHNMDLVDANLELFGALSDLKKEFNYATIIVTSRHASKDSPEVQSVGPWLSNLGETVDGIINTNDAPKQTILNNLNPLMFVDDSVGKLEALYLDDACTKLPKGLKNSEILLFYNDGNKDTKPKGLIKSVDGAYGLKNKLYDILKKNK